MIPDEAEPAVSQAEFSRLRVGVVAMSHPGLGGTFQYTLAMVDALRQVPNIDLHLFVRHGARDYDSLRMPRSNMPNAFRTFWAILGKCLGIRGREAFPGVDVLIAPIYTVKLLAATQPFIFTLHDLQERYYPENFSFGQNVWRRVANWALTRSAASVVCESSHVKADIERYLNVHSSRVAVIPAPPVSTLAKADLSPERQIAAQQKLSLPSIYILYPAQFFIHKNHARLVEAFARIVRKFPDCYLIFTGQKRYEHGRVFELGRSLGVDSRLRHLGFVESDDLAVVYKMATCIAVPTLFESISIPVYEAFMLGVPVCSSNVVALPEQVGDAGLLFDPLSVDDIAAKLERLLEDGPLREHLVVKGRERVAKLTAKAYAASLESLILTVARQCGVNTPTTL
jgi:glycosyltransferase involved in cell wall biosynthesis